ncbi:MAG: hypothetical protein RML94_11815, partial [Bacteroidia bacterium]|nr:hypothetical protein [Bacteroidia bacterium]
MLYKNTEIPRYLQQGVLFVAHVKVVNAVQKYRDSSVFTTWQSKHASDTYYLTRIGLVEQQSYLREACGGQAVRLGAKPLAHT